MTETDPSVQTLEQYFWNSGDLLSVFSRVGVARVRNPAWQKVLGWDPETLAGFEFIDLVHPDDVEATLAEFDLGWSGPAAPRFGFENRLRCRDGSHRWIEWTSHRQGELVYATGRDVTHRNSVLAALDAANQMNTAIFTAATDSIIVIDRQMRIAEFSPSGAQIFGYPDEERIGVDALLIIHVDDREHVRESFQRIFEFDEVATARFRARHSEGHWLIVEARGRSLGVTDGATELAVIICRDVSRAVAEEEALAESLRKITAIVDTAVDVISTIDHDFHALESSPSSELTTGIPADQRDRYPIFDRIHPDDRPHIAEAVQRIFGAGETATVRYRLQHFDGHWMTMESKGRALVDAGGPPTKAVVTSRDISESVEAQKALARSLETTVAIFDATVDGIVLIDNDLRVLESSQAGERFHGVPASQRRGRDVAELVHPDEQEMVRASFRRAFEEDGSVEFRCRMVHREGHLTTIEVRGRPLRDAHGPPTQLVFIARDITESVAAEVALARAFEKTSAILAAAADSIVVIDRDLVIEETSPGTERIFGYRQEDWKGGDALDIMHPDDRPMVRAALGRLFAQGGDDLIDYRFRGRHADGHELMIDTRARLLRDAGGESLRAVLVSRDISDSVARDVALEAARFEAERANQAKSEFMSRMSHELRTPLNSVMGFAQILQLESHSPEVIGTADQIYRSGQHLLNLINEVLDISRIESGTIAVTLEPVSLDELLDECVGLVKPHASEFGIEFVIDFTKGLHAFADRNRLRQVLINLLSNAIKYNRPHGTVTVTCVQRKGRVRIGVVDTGHGIAPELRSRLFTPFDRLGAESKGIEGTGLGLALSKSLAEAMGGQLTVKSKVGQGSTFRIDLPLGGAK